MEAPPTVEPPALNATRPELWRFICYDRGHEHHGTWADNEAPRCHLMVPCASAFCPGPHVCGSPLIRKGRA